MSEPPPPRPEDRDPSVPAPVPAAHGSDAVPGPPTGPPPALLDDRERRLDRRIMRIWQAQMLLTVASLTFVTALPALVIRRPAAALVPLVVVAAGLTLVLTYPPARYRRWRWRLADLALELHRGVVFHRNDAVPYFRIQQIDVQEGPLDRLLGLASLQVTTAAASGSVELPGLPAADAPAIRRDLLHRAALAVGESGDQRDAV